MWLALTKTLGAERKVSRQSNMSVDEGSINMRNFNSMPVGDAYTSPEMDGHLSRKVKTPYVIQFVSGGTALLVACLALAVPSLSSYAQQIDQKVPADALYKQSG